MFRREPDFLVQLATHCLRRTFTNGDPSLRKLPGVLPNALTPENLIFLIYEDNADIGAVTFSV
jgi:hypothetical protein